MITYQQRKTEGRVCTPDQSSAFTQALSAWIEREKLTWPQAAARLEISTVHLGQWLNGTRRPKPEEITHVLERVG